MYHVSFSRWLQEIRWDIFRQLVVLCPLTNSIKVFTFVSYVEVDVCLGLLQVPPDLAEDASIDGTHELLPNDIKTMS